MRRTSLSTLALLGVVLTAALGACAANRTTAGGDAGEPVRDGSRPRVHVIGDSYTGGSDEGGLRDKGWPALLAARLDGSQLSVDAVGGSGYVVDGQGRDGTTFPERAAAITGEPEVVVLFAAGNDVGQPLERVRAGMQHTLAAVWKASPDAELLVIGPVWRGSSPPDGVRKVAQVERDVAEAAGVVYLDGVQDPWFADRPDLIGTDGVHPTDAGHRLMADRIEPSLRQVLDAVGS